MAVVCADSSGGGFSRVFRGWRPHEVQFLELDFFNTICVIRDSGLAVPTADRFSLGGCVDWREESIEKCDGVQRQVFPVARAQVGLAGRVSYLFMGEHGEYYGGDCFCLHLGLAQPPELATIVIHDVRKPELNKIAMGFLFHRLIVLGRGVTDLDKQTADAQTALAEMTSLS